VTPARVPALWLLLAPLLVGLVLTAAPARANDQVGLPVYAYYYIWYTATSWDRAKTDLPLLGNYSSDERSVMEQHVRDAKAAGLDGFLVSWKHTPVLDRRLAMLAGIARAHDFRLGLVYQGLDFFRRPLPAARVASDLSWFADHYGADAAFAPSGQEPLVVWSGTWEFTRRQVARVSAAVRDRLALLGSQRTAEEYRPVSRLLDGDAYYWSSVDPEVDRHAPEVLAALGGAVHRTGGLWFPSAAPGFDARLIGGTRVVPRRGGETLRREWATALDSSADGVAVVSWNEFSENSHVEPSRHFGNSSLRQLAALLGATVPASVAADSSDGGSSSGSTPWRAGLALLIGLGLVPGSLLLVARGRGASGSHVVRPTDRLDEWS
jgi:hypothetical protein